MWAIYEVNSVAIPLYAVVVVTCGDNAKCTSPSVQYFGDTICRFKTSHAGSDSARESSLLLHR